MVSNQTRSADLLKLIQDNTQVLTYERKKRCFWTRFVFCGQFNATHQCDFVKISPQPLTQIHYETINLTQLIKMYLLRYLESQSNLPTLGNVASDLCKTVHRQHSIWIMWIQFSELEKKSVHVLKWHFKSVRGSLDQRE